MAGRKRLFRSAMPINYFELNENVTRFQRLNIYMKLTNHVFFFTFNLPYLNSQFIYATGNNNKNTFKLMKPINKIIVD